MAHTYKEQWEIMHCFILFSALFCYSREQKKILHHVRDHAQWFALHLPWETQLSKQALSIIVHKTWQIVLDRQSCPSFRSVTFQNPQPKPFPTNKRSFLKYRNAHFVWIATQFTVCKLYSLGPAQLQKRKQCHFVCIYYNCSEKRP